MPSDAFIGILSGLGEAHRARQKNIFDQEVDRREQMAKVVEKLADQPDITPEGKDQLYRQAFGIRTFDVNKKLPKEWESLATEVAPKFGQSWLGGQTTNKVEATNMPVASDLEGGATFKDIQGGQVPGLGDKVQSTQTPPPSQYQASMPQPPPGTTRSMRFSPQEISQQKIAEAVQMLQALGPIQQQQALETERAKLAMQPEKFSTASPGSSIVSERTGKITGQAPKPKEPSLDKEVDTFTDAGGYRTTTYQRPDGSTYERRSASKVQPDKPTQPPYIVRVEGAVDAASKELPQDWRNVVRRSMPNTLPAATRLGRMNEAAEYIGAGDSEGLKSRVKQWAIESENVGTQAQVEGRADAMNAMKDAVGLLAQMKREGITTNILTGSWEDILRKLGTTSHPKRVEFASRMQRALSAYTLAMSGVQFGEQEAQRYNKLFPNYSNTMPVNETLAKSLINAMATEDKRFWTQKLGPDGAKLVGATGTTDGGGEQRVRMPSGEIHIYDAQGNYLRTESQ